jgi:hypothetical protein
MCGASSSESVAVSWSAIFAVTIAATGRVAEVPQGVLIDIRVAPGLPLLGAPTPHARDERERDRLLPEPLAERRGPGERSCTEH